MITSFMVQFHSYYYMAHTVIDCTYSIKSNYFQSTCLSEPMTSFYSPSFKKPPIHPQTCPSSYSGPIKCEVF